MGAQLARLSGLHPSDVTDRHLRSSKCFHGHCPTGEPPGEGALARGDVQSGATGDTSHLRGQVARTQVTHIPGRRGEPGMGDLASFSAALPNSSILPVDRSPCSISVNTLTDRD